MSPHIGLNAHLLSAQSGYRRAGIHGYIWQTLEHLPTASPGWRYSVFVGEGEPPCPDAFTIRRSKIDTSKPVKRILWEQIAQPLQLGGLDLVHEMAFVAPLVMPRPFVVTVYDLTFIRYSERLPLVRRLYLRLFTGLSCKRAKRVMAISQSTADDLVHLLKVPSDKIDLAIPGIDPRFRPLPSEQVEAWRERKGLPKRFLLFVGTLEPRKNLPVLLRAYASLPPQDRNDCALVLAGGKGWMADDIYRIVEEYNLSSQVHFPGFVQDDELPLFYNATESFVYPSIFEGWGMPVTEAMACGKPVLVSNVSSLPEASGEVGLQLPPQDVAAWAQALAKCIHESAWRKTQSELALARAAQFTWANTAAQVVACYKKALGVEA